MWVFIGVFKIARESFDKEIELLRMLVLTGGSYSRKESADRLGISVHTLDKALRRLKEVAAGSTFITSVELEETDDSAALTGARCSRPALTAGLPQLLQHRRHAGRDPLLLFLFRAKSLKESETIRLAILLEALQHGPITASELLEACSAAMPEEASLPDEKTIRSDLAYLETAGIVARSGQRPFRFRLRNELWSQLEPEELQRLELFVHVMAGTRVPSVQGFLLQDSLRRSLGETECLSARTGFAYHYDCRILDEAYLYPLLSAIEDGIQVTFDYLTPKSDSRYAARGTNPLHARHSPARKVTLLPLKTIYDHQYGRWYVLGFNRALGLATWRMEGISGLERGLPAEPDLVERKQIQLQEKTRTSWLVDLGQPVHVSVRFFRPQGIRYDFVRERVLLQGQWGTVSDEGAQSFRFDIEVNGTREIRPWLRSFGSSCEVLAPEELRREMIEEWKEISEFYEPV